MIFKHLVEKEKEKLERLAFPVKHLWCKLNEA